MADATAWRLALAQRIAAAYARQPNAHVVMVAGSVGRGRADRNSDIEIDVYYARPPTEQERIAAVAACGGVVEALAEDDDEWEEQMVLDDVHAATRTFLIATMERYLTEVVDRVEIAPPAQVRLSRGSGSLHCGSTVIRVQRKVKDHAFGLCTNTTPKKLDGCAITRIEQRYGCAIFLKLER